MQTRETRKFWRRGKGDDWMRLERENEDNVTGMEVSEDAGEDVDVDGVVGMKIEEEEIVGGVEEEE